MEGNPVSEAEAQNWLRTLGITSLCQWDVVVFLHRHRDSLMGADHLASLLGYETAFIVGAMEELEALGLLRRSRISKGARFYHFIPGLDHRIGHFMLVEVDSEAPVPTPPSLIWPQTSSVASDQKSALLPWSRQLG